MADAFILGLLFLALAVFVALVLFFSFTVFNIILSFKILLRKDRGAFFKRVLIGEEPPWALMAIFYGIFMLAMIFFLYAFGTIAELQGHFPLVLWVIHLMPISLLLALFANTDNIAAILYAYFLPNREIITATFAPIKQFCPFLIMNVFWCDGAGFIAAYSKHLRRVVSVIYTPFVLHHFYLVPLALGLGGFWAYFSGIEGVPWWLPIFALGMILIFIWNLFGVYARHKMAMPLDERLKW